MSNDEWVPGPFGLDAAKGTTVPGQRTVLAVVHHLTAGTRLAEVLPLLESDRRIQVVYTAAPSSHFTGGLADYLHRLGGLTVPWSQAIRTRFDLAIAASNGRLESLHAPVLTLPHGSGPGKLYPRIQGAGPPVPRPVTGVLRDRLVVGGRVVPSAYVLPHERHLRLVERDCPEALPVAVVGGDPCFDRLVESRWRRAAYRRAFGVGRGRRLVLVTSTWGTHSLFGRHPDVLFRVAARLPREEYAVVAALHPGIWTMSGRRQVTRWHTDCLRHGVRLLPPEEGWRAALIAADHVIGDHGSVTYYGAALGVPVALGEFAEEDVAPGSHIARLGAVAPRIDWDAPLSPQLHASTGCFGEDVHAALRAELTSVPGRAAEILRREMYRLMRLAEPDHPARLEPVPLPDCASHDGLRAA
ncbi:hypothetical protein [Actinoallomurus acaciae]|uniref:CDP-Glycerol:Poly(Glycerophosphate) glycerophosphotransferase n=1 Tax=Actinoallomurus acaciae TaxID=502577 RepID=A0ABV5YZC7_9ACTN